MSYTVIIINNNNFSYMKDKCCRHKRLLSHDCVKCIKYKDSNDSSKCEKCSIQDSDKMLCIHGNDDSSKFEKCSIQDT